MSTGIDSKSLTKENEYRFVILSIWIYLNKLNNMIIPYFRSFFNLAIFKHLVLSLVHRHTFFLFFCSPHPPIWRIFYILSKYSLYTSCMKEFNNLSRLQMHFHVRHNFERLFFALRQIICVLLAGRLKFYCHNFSINLWWLT